MSQGGVISLYYSLSRVLPPAGAIAFSSYLLKSTKLLNLSQLPMFLAHGDRDPIIR